MASNVSEWSHVSFEIGGRSLSSLQTIQRLKPQDATSLVEILYLKPQGIMRTLQDIEAVYVAVLAVALSCLLNYVLTRLSFERCRRSDGAALETPPTIPYWLPFLGSSLDFGFNALAFIKSSTKLSKNSPFCVSLLNQKMFFIQGAENIAALWKKSSTMTGTPLHLFCLKYIFGMPPEALDMYAKDDSGLATQPPLDSSVAPNNRVDYRTHVGMLRFTKGAGLSNFCDRLVTRFHQRLAALSVSDQEWLEFPDFMAFFDENFGSALVESICGPSLTRLSPDFAKDFSRYDMEIPGLLKGLPRWLIPGAYHARDKLLASIKQWHAFAQAHFEETSISPDGDADPYWGSLFIRERQSKNGIFATTDNFSDDARAASDLGFIWAANTNLVPSAMWTALETFKDPAVLERVRTELSGTFDQNSIYHATFNASTLQTLPLLQSIYAETLRLRVRAYAARYTDRTAFSIKRWFFPKKSIILVSTTEAHMDESFWNTKGGMHPIDKFWADRFLIYEDDPTSGPQSKTQLSQAQSNDFKAPDSGPIKGPRFSLAGTNGSWLPYGGGARACIGQTFSKRAMLAACAIMAMEFDVRILADEEALGMDPKFYGLGGQRPIGKVPFKIRRRVTGFPGRST